MHDKVSYLVTAFLVVMSLCLPVRGANEPVGESSPTMWESGIYWTYETTRTYSPTTGGSKARGSLTFIVLGGNVCLGNEIWILAAISEWYNGNEIIDTVMHVGPSSLYLRWPIIVDFLPRAKISASETGLTRTAAAFPLTEPGPGLPIRIGRALPVTVQISPPDEPVPDWLADAVETGSTWEAVALTEEEQVELTVPVGTFSSAIPIQYKWEGFGERDSGRAWWVPEVGWWARVEGQEETEDRVTLSYVMALTDWGVLSPEEMESRLTSALQSTEQIDPVAGKRVRVQLENLGFSFPKH